MELSEYDKENAISTITMTDDEFSEILSIIGGVRSTFHLQDPTILDTSEERIIKITNKLTSILYKKMEIKGLKVMKWSDLKQMK